MRYYCKNCGSTVELGDNSFMEYVAAMLSKGKICPVCHTRPVDEIPLFETPVQYEKRTGQPWPDNAPVWVRHDYPCGTWTKWAIDTWTINESYDRLRVQVVCVQSPVPPPDGWKPEEDA